jgi:hypothetical protein
MGIGKDFATAVDHMGVDHATALAAPARGVELNHATAVAVPARGVELNHATALADPGPAPRRG